MSEKNSSIFLVLIFIGFSVQSLSQTISSFSPLSGKTGGQGSTLVTIKGTGFSSTASNNIIFFGAVYSPALTSTSTQLTVLAPASASFQYLSVLNKETGLTAYAYNQNPFLPSFYNEGSINFLASASFSYNTSPTFSEAYNVNLPYSNSLYKIADIDGDGKPDIVYLNIMNNTLNILRNTSGGGLIVFDTLNVIQISLQSGSFDRFAIGDINGDGKPDIVGAISAAPFTTNNPQINIYLNNSVPGNVNMSLPNVFTLNSSNTLHTNFDIYDILITDIDMDGKPDVVLCQDYAFPIINYPGITILLNQSSTPSNLQFGNQLTFGFSVAFLYMNGNTPGKIINLIASDFDSNGKVDIGVLMQSDFSNKSDTSRVGIFYNNSIPGSLAIDSSHTAVFNTGLVSTNILSGDLNGDGKPDLVGTNYGSQYGGKNLTSLRNLGVLGGGNFAYRVGNSLGGIQPDWALIGDFDGDGKPDIAAVSRATNNLYLFRNNSANGGTIQFGARVVIPTNTLLPSYFDLCDFDGDGIPDLFLVGGTTISIVNGALKQKMVGGKLPF